MTERFADELARLPTLLGSHVLLTVLAVALGASASVPLGIAATRRPGLRWLVLGVVGVVQTIPGLALLALMVAALIGANAIWRDVAGDGAGGVRAIGFVPTLAALTLYSMLPIVRNTVAGLVGVDRAAVEASLAMGMTRRQLLTRVELPLAAPVILAGLRTATVWTVGIATLSTPVGQPSLGDYIFQGLELRDWSAVVFGCVAAAALAVVLDQLLGLLENGLATRKRPRVVGALAGLAVVLVVATAPMMGAWLGRGERRVVEVGAKDFNESYILAELMGQQLRDAGFDVRQRQGLGSTVVFDALRAGDIDCYVDYTGTIWAEVMGRTESGEPAAILRGVGDWLRDTHRVELLGGLGFENAYALAVRRELADRERLNTIADLARVAPSLSIGGNTAFFGRAEWKSLQDAYGLRFREERAMKSTLMYPAAGAGEVDVITAYTSDGRITAYDLVVLEDPKRVFPPYDAVVLLSPQAAQDAELRAALQPLMGAIPVEAMREANLWVDRDGVSPGDAAKRLREKLRLTR